MLIIPFLIIIYIGRVLYWIKQYAKAQKRYNDIFEQVMKGVTETGDIVKLFDLNQRFTATISIGISNSISCKSIKKSINHINQMIEDIKVEFRDMVPEFKSDYREHKLKSIL